MTALVSQAGASAPAPSTDVEQIADKDDLFPKRTPKRVKCVLPEAEITIRLEALTPKDYEEVNHAAVTYDGGTPKLDNRLWNARLVARSLRDSKHQRMYKDEMGWRALAIDLAEKWTIGDLQKAAESAADVSGISAKARKALEEVLGKDSSEMETAG